MVRVRLLASLCALAVAGVLSAAHAGPAVPGNPFFNISANSSLQYLEPFPGTSFFNGGQGFQTSTTNNPNNSDFAEAFTNPLATNVGNFGPMGVAASLGDQGSARASAEYSDAWFCFGHCSQVSTGINVFLDINGTASNITDGSFVELDVDLQIGTGDLHFTYFQDGSSEPPSASATVDGKPIFVGLSLDPTTQLWSFSLQADTSLTVCSAANVCPDNVAKACGDGCDIPTFTTDESVTLTVDGEGAPVSLDAFDPIGFGFTSDNPDTQIVNAAGFAAPVVPAAVPEPDSGILLLGGLAALAGLSRRRRR